MARQSPMQGRGDGKKRTTDTVSIWKERSKRQGVDWSKADILTMRACFSTACAAGVAVMISGASGGLGVCVTVWADGERHKEYASDVDELMELLDGIIDAYSSTSEDARAAMGSA